MKKFILPTICFVIFTFGACKPKTNELLTGKKWYVYCVGISFLQADGSEGEPKLQYYKKERAAATHWTFTDAGNYTIVEEGEAAGGKWQLNGDADLTLTEMPNDAIKQFDIQKITPTNLTLKHKSAHNNPISSFTVMFTLDISTFATDNDIDILNGDV